MKKIAIIPAYEPDKKLIKLLEELNDNNFEVIVVDDGSDTGYEKIFSEASKKAKVLTHKENKGKGAALKTALSYIQKHYKEVSIVTMDCDGQHRVVDAEKLIKKLENNKDSIILGKRIRSKNTPLRSKLGNMITRVTFTVWTGKDIYDTQTGLRCFKDEQIDFLLKVKGERFEYEMNVLLEATKNNIDILEVPIKTIYFDNNSKSHFNTLKDSYRIYKNIFLNSSPRVNEYILEFILYILFSLFLPVILSNLLALLISFLVLKLKERVYTGFIETIVLFVISFFINIYVAKVLSTCLLFIVKYIRNAYE